MKGGIDLLLIFFALFVVCCKTSVPDTGEGAFYIQADSLFERATVCQQARDFTGAIDLYKTLLDRNPSSAEDGTQAASLLKEALIQMMYCHFFSGQRGSAAAYYTAFYADTTRWLVRHYPRNVEICLGYSFYEAARLEEAVAMIEKALARPEEGIPADELYADYGIAGAVYNQTGDVRKAIACTEKCAEVLRTLDDKTDLINALGNLIYQYQQVGEFDKSLVAYEELIRLQEVKDNPYHRCVAEVNIVSLFHEWGLEEEEEKHFAAAVREAHACGIPDALLRVKNMEVAKLFERGDTRAISIALDTLAALLPPEAEGSFYRIYYNDFCLVASLLKASAGQEKVFRQARQRLEELQVQPLDRLHCDLCCYLGNAFTSKGYVAEAIKAYEVCVPYIRDNRLLGPRRLVYRQLARLYAQQGDSASAIRYYELYDTANGAFTARRSAGLMSQFRVKYETREKEQANELLRAEIRSQHRNLQYYIMIGIAVLLLFVSLAIWGFMRHRALRLRHAVDARQHELDLLHQQEAQRVIEEQEGQLRQMFHERLELNRKNEDLRVRIEQSRTEEQSRKLVESLLPRLLTRDEELYFRQQFMSVYPTFLTNLRQRLPAISRGEELLTMLVRLKFSSEDIAFALGINRGSVNTSRSRLRKKIELSTDESLEDFIQQL